MKNTRIDCTLVNSAIIVDKSILFGFRTNLDKFLNSSSKYAEFKELFSNFRTSLMSSMNNSGEFLEMISTEFCTIKSEYSSKISSNSPPNQNQPIRAGRSSHR